MKKKLYTLLAICFLTSQAAFAQSGKTSLTDNALPQPDSAAIVFSDSEIENTELKFKPEVRYSVNMGASFSNFGSATYIQPRVEYQLSEKFKAYTGISIINYNSRFNSFSEAPFNSQQTILEVGGDYQVTNKLILGGSVWRDFNNLSLSNSDYSTFQQKPIQGIDARMHYKVTKNISVTGQFRYSSGQRNPYDFRPFTPVTGF